MPAPTKALTILRYAGAAVGIWLCGAGAALAGDGGAALAPLQKILNGTCATVGIAASACPQLPTINQLVIEIAALSGKTPNQVRDSGGVPPGLAFDAGTQPGLSPVLAFVSPPNKTGIPIPTSPSNPAANTFVSATNTNGTLALSFDYRPRTNPIYALGADVGDITLPFVVADANGNGARDVSAQLHIAGTGGSTVVPTITGDFLNTGTPQTDTPAQLGMSFALSFASGNAIFDLSAPLLVSAALAPGLPSPRYAGFEFDPTDGLFDGINPVATFLHAHFLNDANDPFAASVDLALTTAGDTLFSDPLPEPEPASLALLGMGLAGLAVIRRRHTAAA